MKNFLLATILSLTVLTGCGRFDPLSPDLKNKIDNQQGQIEDINNNQNGIMAEIGKLRQQNETNARDIRMNNSGIQILSGEGGLIVFLGMFVFGTFLIYHYRLRALKSEKTSEILAQQIAMFDDVELDDKILLSAMNTDVEKDVYHLLVRCQNLVGKPKS